mgnify:CR=1 FL=1
MLQRIITAVVALVVLGVVFFVLPPVAVHVTLGLIILAGAWEWSGLLGGNSLPVRLVFVALIAGLLATTVLFLDAYSAQILIASLLWWSAALVWILFYPTPIPQILRWLAGIITLVPLYIALVGLYDVDLMILIFALLVIWVADSGAYLAGRMLGRVKLAPQVSPGKTWEGVIGGFVAVALLVWIRSFYVETDLKVLIPFCLAAAALSIVGDLTVSMFKRTAGVKDSGRLFPGHGGVLDRVDSVSAAAPLLALGISWGAVV